MTLASVVKRLSAWATLIALGLAGGPSAAATSPLPAVEFGMDRSNMATEWTLSPPAEPDVYPFNRSYNGAGVFEARRTAVFDGIARLHPRWFRDGFGGNTPADVRLFADTVAQVHARGMKMLAVVGPSRADFDPKDVIPGDPAVNGCRWATAPLEQDRPATVRTPRPRALRRPQSGRTLRRRVRGRQRARSLLQRRRHAAGRPVRRAPLEMVPHAGPGTCVR